MKKLLLLLALIQLASNLNCNIYYIDFDQCMLYTNEGRQISNQEKIIAERWKSLLANKSKNITNLRQSLLKQEAHLRQRKSKLNEKFDLIIYDIMTKLKLSSVPFKKLPYNFKDKFNLTPTVINRINQKKWDK